jgi:endopeptidase La
MKIITIVTRGLTALPDTILSFDVSRKESISAVNAAHKKDEEIFIVSQIDPFNNEFKEDALYKYGTVGKIDKIVKFPQGGLRVLVNCNYRAKLSEVVSSSKIVYCNVEKDEAQKDVSVNKEILDAMLNIVRDKVSEYAKLNEEFETNDLPMLMSIEELDTLIYSVAITMPWRNTIRQNILEIFSLEERYVYLCNELITEIHLFGVKRKVASQLKDNLDQHQREYYLREQLKVIRQELGEDSEIENASYESKINELNLNQKYKDKLLKDVSRIKVNAGQNAEANILRTYLDTVLEIPWGVYTTDNKDIKYASKILEQDHYGLQKIKERIIEYLAVRILNPNSQGAILCLAGPPGTGKTSIAKSVAKALGRKYVRLSLGGVKDEAEIRGHRKTYIGAMPGRLVDALRQAKSSNPLILLDEIDKTSGNHKGDLSSALLEVLDGEQNIKFRDNYVEIPIDLSKVLFLATANFVENIPAPLLDRMEIIEVSSYTENEKFHIARDYLVKKQIVANGLNEKEVEFTDEALKRLIHNYTREAGVRRLERNIGEICRKCARNILEEVGDVVLEENVTNKEKNVKKRVKRKIKIKDTKLEKYLGKPRYNFETVNEKDEVGIVRGLAWTPVGGDTLQIEVNILKGKAGILLTGRMGDVMKESAKIGLSYIRSIMEEYNIESDFFDTHEIHIHIPEGAVPKDGPSAGITMAVAILSAITGIKVKAFVAMTGEITLRGRVLPVGGLKEKILAARLAGIKTIIVPEKNKLDILELSEEITGGLDIKYVDSLKQVIDIALVKE